MNTLLPPLSSSIAAPITTRSSESAAPRWKRALDVSCILISSILWGPVCLLLVLYIKLVSPGPALFKQERVGLGGRSFRCFKFRTMKLNADTVVHQQHLAHLLTSNQPMQKLDAADPRLIPGGLWIRSLGLDELAQLFNVLRGDMSLVGPRPCLRYEYELFHPEQRRRCDTLPGLTGLWQVNGKNRTTFERMIELDLAYVVHKSLWLDVKILSQTFGAVAIQVWDAMLARRALRRAGEVARSTPVLSSSLPSQSDIWSWEKLLLLRRLKLGTLFV